MASANGLLATDRIFLSSRLFSTAPAVRGGRFHIPGIECVRGTARSNLSSGRRSGALVQRCGSCDAGGRGCPACNPNRRHHGSPGGGACWCAGVAQRTTQVAEPASAVSLSILRRICRDDSLPRLAWSRVADLRRDPGRHPLLAGEAFLGGYRRQTRNHGICGHRDHCGAGPFFRIESSEPRGRFRRSRVAVGYYWRSAVSVSLTYWLSEHRKFGAVFGSAVPSAVLVFGVNLLSPSWQLKMIPLGTAWFGASFAGMTSVERLDGRHWTLPLIGLIYGFLSMDSGPRLHGFGGGLGTTALVSVLAAFGIARLLGAKPVRFARYAWKAVLSGCRRGCCLS